MSVLSDILARKRERVAEAKSKVSLDQMRNSARELRRTSRPHRFREALQVEGPNIIAEFKRRSPSKGVIRADVEVEQLVTAYRAGGAAAISVLTEEDYFDGSLEDLRRVKKTVDLPVLRKDFLFDEYQIFEAAVNGAEAILLIVAALDAQTLSQLRQLAEDELGIDALVEVHDETEMQRAAAIGATIIGVNNRNLHTFEVTLQTSVRLAQVAPAGTILISESGLRNAADLKLLKDVGYQGFLIGETLMRAQQPELLLKSLIA